MTNSDVDILMNNLQDKQYEFMKFFIEYMRKNHPDIPECISFAMPTYKLGNGKSRNYIAFYPAKKHFSIHSLDFENINALKEKLSMPGKGKGCANIQYSKENEMPIVTSSMEKIIQKSKSYN